MTVSRASLVQAWHHWDASKVFRAHLISRQVITILITWILARSSLSLDDIGTYELLHLLGYGLTFFWLDAALRGFTKVNRELPEGDRTLFTRQVAGTLALASLGAFLLGLFLARWQPSSFPFGIPAEGSWSLFGVFYLSFHLSSMVEVLYLQQERPASMMAWSAASGLAQLALLGIPVIVSGSLEAGLAGLALFGLMRLLWFLRYCRPVWPSFRGAMGQWRSVSWPLALSGLIGGSAVLIDGFVIMAFSPEGSDYAVYRYGARELPFAILVATGLEWVLLDRLSGKTEPDVIQAKRFASKWLLRLVPLAVLAMLLSGPAFVGLYGERFAESAAIFRIYLLLILSRFVLSGPILIALGDTKAILSIGTLEALLNLGLSWWWVGLWGPAGVAWATVAAFFFDKLAQLFWLRYKYGIPASRIIPIWEVIAYGVLLLLIYQAAPLIPVQWPE